MRIPTFRRPVRSLLGLVLASLLLVASAGLASAQEVFREFTGRIDRINKKQMIVDNRMGDKVKFMYAGEETSVKGTKDKWKDLKKKDWVTVSWRFTDKPRKAYIVDVLDKKDEE